MVKIPAALLDEVFDLPKIIVCDENITLRKLKRNKKKKNKSKSEKNKSRLILRLIYWFGGEFFAFL